jgi:hypothetical protein
MLIAKGDAGNERVVVESIETKMLLKSERVEE